MAESSRVVYAVSLLVGGTGGQGSWPDETIHLYVHELGNACSDRECLVAACRTVVRDWTEQGRPPLGVIREAYRSEVVRHEMLSTGELAPSTERIPTFEEGIEIARQAYHAECYRQGRDPSNSHFEQWLGLSKEDRRARAAEAERKSAANRAFRRR